jgi:methionyl-tRNA formyltransferase
VTAAPARVGFAGTSAYGADCLRGLCSAGLEIGLVLSQPDRRAGRRRQPTPPPVAAAAAELGLPLVQPQRAIDALPQIRAAGLASMAICAYGQLLPAALLAELPWFNLHPSLLPRWRGAAPVERAILAGDEETGVAVMVVVAELDAGPLVSLDRFPIAGGDDAGAVMAQSLAIGGPRLARAVTDAGRALARAVPQAADGVRYAAKLGPEERLLDPAGPAAAALRQVRALSPHIGAQLSLAGARFVVWRAQPADRALPAGAVAADDGRIVCGFGDGAVELLQLQAPGRRALSSAELLRGWRGPLGPAARAA